MKIVSWNVNSLKARLPHIQQYLQDSSPDVLMLQELKGLDFPDFEFRALGYETLAATQKAYNGVAILSKAPITPILKALPGDESDEQARYLEADIEGVRVINIYLPNGNPVATDSDKFPYKLKWMERLFARIKQLRADHIPFLIGGDYNIIPEDKDCYNPAKWEGDALTRPESRARFRALLNLGLTDAYRALTQSAGKYSYWDYQQGAWQNDNGIRIDHFLTSPQITDRIAKCEINKIPRGWDRPSDHTPIELTLKSA